MADNQILVEIKGKSEQMVQAVEKANQKLHELAEATKRAETGWNGLLSKLGNFGMVTEGIKNVGGSIVNIGKALLSTFVDLGAQLDSISKRTNISIESLSQLKYAAEQSGVGFETLTDAIKAYSNQLGAAQLGNDGARKKLEGVGIDFTEYAGLSEKDQFLKLAEHISKIKNSAEQTRTAIELFGESGYKLLPFFQQGEEGIRRLCEEADDLGFTFHSKDAANAAELSGKIATLKSALESTGRSIISALVEPLTSLAESLSDVARWVAKWINEHPTITKGFVYLAGGIAAAGAALTAFSIVSTMFMATNPFGWALLGIGAVAGLTVALMTATEAVTDFDDDVKDADEKLKALNATAGDTQKIMDSFQQENAALDGLVDQIQSLCDKEELTNAEKEKMIELIQRLQEEFPGLNVQIDAATGKMENLTQKYIEMEKAAARKKLGDLKSKAQEYADNKLRAEVDRDFEAEKLQKTFGNVLRENGQGIGYRLTDDSLSWDERQRMADESGYRDIQQAFAAYRKYAEVVDGWEAKIQETKASAAAVKEEATGNIGEYVKKRAAQALAKVEADERAAEEKNLDEFQKRGREIAKEYNKRIANLRAYKAELETLQQNGGLDAMQEQRLAGLEDEITALEDERSEKYMALADEKEQKAQEAAAEAARQRAELLHNIMVTTGEIKEDEKSEAEQKLADLKAQNAEYLRQLELVEGITEEELKQARNEAKKREREMADRLIKEGATNTDPYQAEIDKAEKELIEAQHSGGDVEGAAQRLETARKNAENASYEKAHKELEDANAKAAKSREEFEKRQKEGAPASVLLALQKTMNEDAAAAKTAMENFRKFAKPVGKDQEDTPTQRPFDTTIGSSTKGTFSIYGMGATVDNLPQQQLDYLKKIYMLLGLFDREPALRLI